MTVKRIEPIKDNSIFTREEIEEFKQIALKEYGVKLTDEQAFEQGYAIVSLVETVIKKTIEKRKLLSRLSSNKNSL
jgi:hypothetical protein